jgi:DNA replication protein DnaC
LVWDVDKAYQDAVSHSRPVFPSQKTTVVSGQPGIGKHILYYV